MLNDTPDTWLANGETLKRRLISSVSDTDAMRLAARNPQRYKITEDASRPNMFKARDDALSERTRKCSPSDPWVREIIDQWCKMSGLTASEADFWRELGFLEAIKNARSLQIRRFLDDDGWAWIVVRDIPSYWLHRKRLPEATRQKMVEAAKRKQQAFKSRW